MNSKAETKTILIVGDWVVDEYWFVVRHNSDVSSHTGFVHYRISSKPTEIVRDLCGAGHVARLLYEHHDSTSKAQYDFFGLGQWHINDEPTIKHLLHARMENVSCNAAIANYRLTPDLCGKDPENIQLRTIRPNCHTVRVIRTYNEQHEGLTQLDRIDWEPEQSVLCSDEPISFQKLELPSPQQVAAIVLYDLNKGMVNKQLIDKLNRQYPSAKWFIRTKDINPEWLSVLKGDIRLFLVGPETAALQNPWDRWLINGKITSQGMEILRKVRGANTFLASDRREVIAFVDGPRKTCITGKSAIIPQSVPAQLGWASALFASLILSLIGQTEPFLDANTVEQALRLADAEAGVPAPERFRKQSIPSTAPAVYSSDWEEEQAEWRAALDGDGIIKEENGNLRMDVWRGSTQISGYVACIDRKKTLVDEIGRRIRAFTRGGESRSLSILFQADPGAGKTYLARSLARAFDLTFLEFDVTQMLHREELHDLFDTIATRQANTSKKLLVFVDEINAKLDGEHVYGAFLSPLDNGIYKRRGNTFSLQPSIWIFAGTKLDDDDVTHADKLSDFTSRMSLVERIDYQSLMARAEPSQPVTQQARLEQVYLGATLIRKEYPDIQEISEEVLRSFYHVEPDKSPARLISQRVATLRNVQYGRITRRNCEPNWAALLPKDKGSDIMVRLVFE